MSPLVHSASEQRWTLIPKVTGIVLMSHSRLGTSDRPDSTVAVDDSNPRPSRIVSYDEKNKDRGHFAPETSTRGIVVGGTEHGGDRTGEFF